MGMLGIGLTLGGGRPGNPDAAAPPASTPLLAAPPSVAGSEMETTAFTIQADDIWTLDAVAVPVTERLYRLILEGAVVVGPQAGATLTLPPDSSGQAYAIEMQVVAGGIRTAWTGIASGTVQPVFELSTLVEGEIMIGNAAGTMTVTITSPAVYAGSHILDSAELAGGPVNLVPPVIEDDGTPAEGETLTIIPGLWIYDPDNGGLTTPTYRWQADMGGDGGFSDVSGATSETYTLSSGEAGDNVRVVETLADNAGIRMSNSGAVSVIGAPATLWTPASMPAVGLWVDASDAATLTVSGPGITAWADKSGNGRSATATVPLAFGADLNGLPTIRVDNPAGLVFGGFSAGNPFSGSAPKTIFHVGANATANTFLFGLGIDASSNGAGQRFQITLDQEERFVRIQVNNGTYISSLAAGTGAFLAAAATEGTNLLGTTSYLAGQQEISTATRALATSTGAAIGISAGGVAVPGGADHAEILAFPTVLSEQDRQRVEGYLAHKWGLTGDLPANHPFKTSPPIVE